MSEAIKDLDDAILKSNPPPKGIKVGGELWKELKKCNRIKWVRGYLKNKSDASDKGSIDSEVDFPVINDNIFVHVEPDLGDLEYELPPNS